MTARQSKKTKGFTLLELLVVLAIMAVLVMLAVPAVLTAQKASRDAGRVKILQSVQAAAGGVFTKTNSSVTIPSSTSTGTPPTNTVKIVSGPTSNQVTSTVDIRDYTLKILTSGSCDPTTNKSNDKEIVAIHTAATNTRTLTYCNEDGNAGEVLNY